MTRTKAAAKIAATAKIVLTEAIGIPFDKLSLSQANVRKIAEGMASRTWPPTSPIAACSSP